MTEQNQLNWQHTNLDNIKEAWQGDLWDRKRLGIQLTNYVDRLNWVLTNALWKCNSSMYISYVIHEKRSSLNSCSIFFISSCNFKLMGKISALNESVAFFDSSSWKNKLQIFPIYELVKVNI